MRNRAETSLSNQALGDPTAGRAISNADRKGVGGALAKPKRQENTVNIFSKDDNTDLEFALARLRKLQKEGRITKTQRRALSIKFKQEFL